MSRTAKVLITQSDLRRLLNVPPDVTIQAIQSHLDPMIIEVIVEGDRFDPVPANSESPVLYKSACPVVDWGA